MKHLMAAGIAGLVTCMASAFAQTTAPEPPGETPANGVGVNFDPDAQALNGDESKAQTEIDLLLDLLKELRFTFGTRFLKTTLLENIKGRPFENSFIGSIYKLNIVNDVFDFRPYGQVAVELGPMLLGVGMTADKLTVQTDDDLGGDGDVIMKLSTSYIMAAIQAPYGLMPYAEVGATRSSNDFNPLPRWHADGMREFDLEDSSSGHRAIGCAIFLASNLSIDLYMRWTDIDVDGIYRFRGDDREPEPFTFTMKHRSSGFGISYTF